MKKITNRKFKDGKMKKVLNLEGSYRDYEFRIVVRNTMAYTNDTSRMSKRYKAILEFPTHKFVYQCAYVKLKPQDNYLPDQTDWYSNMENGSFLYTDEEITYDSENSPLGSGRWIGVDFAHFWHLYNCPASYTDALKAVRNIIDEIIKLREENGKEKVV